MAKQHRSCCNGCVLGIAIITSKDNGNFVHNLLSCRLTLHILLIIQWKWQEHKGGGRNPAASLVHSTVIFLK